jgi:SAM-dependent methyltransferase
MTGPSHRIKDLGDRRVLTVDGREYSTRYSERVIRMLVERKGPHRAHLYFPFKDERAPLYLDPLFRWLRGHGAGKLSVLEVGCSFGHMTEYLDEQPEVATLTTFDVDRDFVEIVRTKVQELQLRKVKEVALLSNEAARHLPWRDGAFDLVLAIGVIEHLPWDRRGLVDEYYRILAPGGHIAILDTPNRWFPIETHSLGLVGVQWMKPTWAYRYARRFQKIGDISYETFIADGTGWRNATLKQCLPSSGLSGFQDVTEAAGYGWQFFPKIAGRRISRLKPILAACVAALRAVGQPPSLCLPYFNLLFRKRPAPTRRG